jgi:endonuclease III
VYRVASRLALIRQGASFDEAHDEMLRLVDPGDAYETHVLLIRHGRRTCIAREPRCADCPLRRMCPEGRRRLRRR